MLGGLALVVPAALACVIGYVWPTLRTGWASLQRGTPFESPEFAGLDNYAAILGEPERLGLWFALSLAAAPLGTLLVVAPLLAWAAHRVGWQARWATRLALAVPMVCLAPVALAIAWAKDRQSRAVLADLPDRFADVDEVTGSLRTISWLATAGLVCAVGVTVFLAALRSGSPPDAGGGPRRPAWPAVLVVAGLATITTVAVALQTFTYPYALTGGGPALRTTTPMVAAFQSGLVAFDLGRGHAYAMLVLLPVMALGVAAAALMISTRLRVELQPPRSGGPTGWTRTRVVALVGLAVGLVVVLAVTGYGLAPWISGLSDFGPDTQRDPAGLLGRTWLPTLVSTVLGVGLAALAGFGIGALRPLGRWSEVLLLPFAPWLFVGVGPLFLVKFDTAREGPLERIDTVLGLIPPVWLVVPALFLFTLLFRGLAGQGRNYQQLLLPALPMLILVGGATWLVQSQSLLWAMTVAHSPDRLTAPVAALRNVAQFGQLEETLGLGLVLPLPMIVLFAAALAILQLSYLDRLAIRAGS